MTNPDLQIVEHQGPRHARNQVREIFKAKYKSQEFEDKVGQIKFLSKQYRISDAEIQDIWCGKSWLDVTYDLWQEVIQHYSYLRKEPCSKSFAYSLHQFFWLIFMSFIRSFLSFLQSHDIRFVFVGPRSVALWLC